MKVFKIRDANGLYSTGGTSPEFTQGGKVWNNIGHVKSHLRQFMSRSMCYAEIYLNAEIVTIEYTEKDVSNESVLDMMGSLNDEDMKYATLHGGDWRMKEAEEVRNAIGFLKYKRDQNV